MCSMSGVQILSLNPDVLIQRYICAKNFHEDLISFSRDIENLLTNAISRDIDKP